MRIDILDSLCAFQTVVIIMWLYLCHRKCWNSWEAYQMIAWVLFPIKQSSFHSILKEADTCFMTWVHSILVERQREAFYLTCLNWPLILVRLLIVSKRIICGSYSPLHPHLQLPSPSRPPSYWYSRCQECVRADVVSCSKSCIRMQNRFSSWNHGWLYYFVSMGCQKSAKCKSKEEKEKS